MMNYNRFRFPFRTFAAVAALSMATLTGCIETDDTLGSAFLPGNQDMTTGTLRMANAKRYLETRLFLTDSVRTSNLGSGYFGTQRNDTTGLTSTGFLSQYMSYYQIDSGYFGYRPIFDSAQILFTINSFGHDTLTPQQFNVYEITSYDYLTQGDSLFYMNFDPSKYVGNEPLFSFTFPDGTVTGPATRAVTMTPTLQGREFVQRLMISDGIKHYQPGVWYSIYHNDNTFVKTFKGLYITPSDPRAMTNSKGTIFGTDLTTSGFSIYCRSRLQADPTLIKDTLKAFYYFNPKNPDPNEPIFFNANQSVTVVEHDYTGSLVDAEAAKETLEDRPLSTSIIVSGMGGVVSELTFAREFFEELKQLLADSKSPSGEPYTSLAVNRALLTIYFRGSDYNWENVDPGVVTPLMDAAIPRLGSYTNYKTLTSIPDYDYYSEKTYNTTLAYGGNINRSQACYTLNISGYIQLLWNRYLEVEKATNGAAVDLSKIDSRSIFLSPEAYSLFTPRCTVVQGMVGEGNTAPVKIDLTYTLIK